jgi:hypothetical protein
LFESGKNFRWSLSFGYSARLIWGCCQVDNVFSAVDVFSAVVVRSHIEKKYSTNDKTADTTPKLDLEFFFQAG